jgi:hypothetical protein
MTVLKRFNPMDAPKNKTIRILFALIFVSVFFLSSFAAAPRQPLQKSWNSGNVCNYSSKDLALVMQRGQDVKVPGWKVLKPGACQKDDVLAILGRKCSGSVCSTQLIILNNGRVIVMDSLRVAGGSQSLLAVVPQDIYPKTVPINQSTWYAFNTYKSSFMRTLPYTLELEKVKFKRPVTQVGDGAPKAMGSPAHNNQDVYAVDFPAYINWDKRNPDVRAALPGQVVYSDCTTDYGCAVVVRTFDTNKYGVIYYAVYARLAKDGRPAVGTLVDSTKLVGQIDTTSGNKGSYLHFAVRTSNALYDGVNALYGNGLVHPFNARWFFSK